jgi:chemotaxis protein MotB
MADCPKCPPAGAPLWLATFADLMSLLMCFFVLLLSFATMDAAKFKKMAESMENAFGVQKDIPATETPMGTSIIAQHFSPAQTDPTPLEQIKQTTSKQSDSLDVDAENMESVQQQLLEMMQQQVDDQVEQIKESLKDEIEKGLVAVESNGLKIIVRIEEKGSFSSGSAVLKSGFDPVMKKITHSVKNAKGMIKIAGHTDNIPINTDWYRSNWELSASRAVTVAHQMLAKGIDQSRINIEGYADTKPLVPNTSSGNRAKNRRVEIVITQKPPEVNEQQEIDRGK